MGCSGGGGATTTTSSGPPPQVLQAYQDVTNQSKAVAGQPLQQYPGSLVAGFTPDQLQAFGTIRGAQGVQQPYINNAAALMESGAAPIQSLDALNNVVSSGANLPGNTAPYQDAANKYAGWTGNMAASLAPNVSPYQTAASQNINLPGYNSLSTYFNPYQQNVTAATQRLFNEQNAEQLQQVRGNATLQNAFGGDREAISEAETARQQKLAQDPTLAGIQQQGFAQAQGELNTQQQIEQARQQAERQNAIAAGQLGLSAGVSAGQLYNQAGQLQLGAGNLGTSAAQVGGQLQLGANQGAVGAQQATGWLQQGAGYGLANLGGQDLNLALAGANAQYGAGSSQQGLAQQNLNIPYQMFTQQQAYPFQTTNYLANIAEGIGGASGGVSSTTQPPASALGQIAGLGVAGAGIYGLGNQQGWWGGGGGGGVVPTDSPVSMAGNFGSFENRGGRVGYDDGGPVPTPAQSLYDKLGQVKLLELRRAFDDHFGGNQTSFEDMAKRDVMNGPIPLRRYGGHVPHFANGGMSMIPGIPDVSISYVPTDVPTGPRSGILSPMQPVTTQSQSGGGGGGLGQAAGAISAAAKIASLFAVRNGGRIRYADGGVPIHTAPNLDPIPKTSPNLAPAATLDSIKPTQNYAVAIDSQNYPFGMNAVPPDYHPSVGSIQTALKNGILDRPVPASSSQTIVIDPAANGASSGIQNIDPAIANFFTPDNGGGGGGWRGGIAGHFDSGGAAVPDLSEGYVPKTTPLQHRVTIPNPPQPQQQSDPLKDINSSVGSLEKLFKASDSEKAFGGPVDLGAAWRGYDYGGSVQTAGQDMSGGASPTSAGLLQQYLSMPVEQLQELAMRTRSQPNSTYGKIIQQALQMKHMNPTVDQQQQPASAGGMATPSMAMNSPFAPTLGMAWRGGRQHFAEGGDPTPEDDDTAFTRSADPALITGAEREAASQRIEALLSKYRPATAPPKETADTSDGEPNLQNMKDRGLFEGSAPDYREGIVTPPTRVEPRKEQYLSEPTPPRAADTRDPTASPATLDVLDEHDRNGPDSWFSRALPFSSLRPGAGYGPVERPARQNDVSDVHEAGFPSTTTIPANATASIPPVHHNDVSGVAEAGFPKTTVVPVAGLGDGPPPTPEPPQLPTAATSDRPQPPRLSSGLFPQANAAPAQKSVGERVAPATDGGYAPAATAAPTLRSPAMRSGPTTAPASGLASAPLERSELAGNPAALVKHYESKGDYNVGFGQVDLSNAPHYDDGFPIWEGRMGPAGNSHAAGAYQFEPALWHEYAARLGIHDFKPESQDRVFRAVYLDKGFAPWAPYNKDLASAIGYTGGRGPGLNLASEGPGVGSSGGNGNAPPGAGGDGAPRPGSSDTFDRMAAANRFDQHDRSLGASPWLALTAAGLGIMNRAGQPGAKAAGLGVLGGGLEGVKVLEQQYAQSNKNEITAIRAQAVENQARHYFDQAQNYILNQQRLSEKDGRIAEMQAANIALKLADLDRKTAQGEASIAEKREGLELRRQLAEMQKPTSQPGYNSDTGQSGTWLIPHGATDDQKKWTWVPGGPKQGEGMSDKDFNAEVLKAVQQDPEYMSGDPQRQQAALNRAAAGMMHTQGLQRRMRAITEKYPDAQLAPDGHFYTKDTTAGREGKFLRVD